MKPHASGDGQALQRFMGRVRKTSGCWLWRGPRDGAGYGVVRVDGESRRAHRVSWELHRGPIPAGMLVCHRCDNPPCVNPDHLFVGTHGDNQADKVAKGRQARGAAMPNAVLTEPMVVEIRSLISDGELTQQEIAHRFGVSVGAVFSIAHGRGWKHVNSWDAATGDAAAAFAEASNGLAKARKLAHRAAAAVRKWEARVRYYERVSSRVPYPKKERGLSSSDLSALQYCRRAVGGPLSGDRERRLLDLGLVRLREDLPQKAPGRAARYALTQEGEGAIEKADALARKRPEL